MIPPAFGNLHPTFLSVILTILDTPCSIFLSYDWGISFSMMSWCPFMQEHITGFFVRLHNCSHLLAILNIVAMHIGSTYVFEILFWVVLGKYPEVGLVEHIVFSLFIFFGGISIFFIMAAYFYFLTNSAFRVPTFPFPQRPLLFLFIW